MEFNEQHLVIIDTLSREEAVAFIAFLRSEIIRHLEDVKNASDLISEIEVRLQTGQVR